jgi:hypothetical protein
MIFQLKYNKEPDYSPNNKTKSDSSTLIFLQRKKELSKVTRGGGSTLAGTVTRSLLTLMPNS